ncbi:hypothetical protein FGADI_7002 [Fusarium gaditjirri]|uniref:Uncharacterized protein n=1 Tax=Fusarium gaditjirri TaxID=282569 RepID=A0A8H4T6I3_9HYPO|nr:hypothetical protein FGADI_7002 [Fusarium gaditjirri]
MATSDAPWTITHSILHICILTLIACIYTALHLDVPIKTAWHYLFGFKLKWVAITLFAPEIAPYMAVDQLQQAWNLRSKPRSLQKTTPSDPDYKPLSVLDPEIINPRDFKGEIAWRYPTIWTLIPLRDAIWANFSFHNREALVKTASFVKLNSIAWDFEMISPADDAGPQARQDLFLARLPESKPVLDPAYRTMPFNEGKRNLDINFSVFTESEGVFGLLGFFQQFPWLAGLACIAWLHGCQSLCCFRVLFQFEALPCRSVYITSLG